SDGDDVLDMSGLASAHRVVFHSNGGDDVILGALRAQDEVPLMEGKTVDDYVLTENDDGTSTLATDGHSITFDTQSGLPKFVDGQEIEEQEEEEDSPGNTNPTPPANSLPTVPATVQLPNVNANATLTILASMLLA